MLQPAESFGQMYVPSKVSKVDDFFQLDKYQLIMLLFNELLIFNILSNQVFNVFGVAPPKLVGCGDQTYDGLTRADRCAQYANDSDCVNPRLEYEFASATVEFQQFCPRREYTFLDKIVQHFGIIDKMKFSTTIQMVGLIIGAAVAGQLSDSYGRRKVLLASMICICFLSTILSFSPSIDFYIIFRFFIGIFIGSLTTVGPIFVLECLPVAHRFWIATVVTWGPNFAILSLIAYLTGEWRLLSRVSNAISVLGVLVLVFFLEESPKFFVQKRRREEAIKALVNINKWKHKDNQIPYSEIVAIVSKETGDDGTKESLLSAETRPKKYTFLDLYTTGPIALKTAVTSFGLFSVSLVSYALIFNLHVIPGSLYLNMAASGVLRWGIGAVVAITDHFGGARVGRKMVHFVTVGAVAICFALLFLIVINGLKLTYPFAVQACTLVAFGITGCIFLQMALAVAEQFPTAVRNLANANANVCGRLGSVIGPLLFSMDIGIRGSSYLIMSMLALLDLILFQVFLKESKGAPLPDEMPERRRRSNNA
ncbi:unnamed protein product, partial [Mesorhabditis belari]|uniref:Major facilitator superfamily (MFS) profile domain-containing protein n=1 Tax=Mesorhabditis belari TaxID=2138241 RepID=A0AAF3EB79_9BILA